MIPGRQCQCGTQYSTITTYIWTYTISNLYIHIYTCKRFISVFNVRVMFVFLMQQSFKWERACLIFPRILPLHYPHAVTRNMKITTYPLSPLNYHNKSLNRHLMNSVPKIILIIPKFPSLCQRSYSSLSSTLGFLAVPDILNPGLWHSPALLPYGFHLPFLRITSNSTFRHLNSVALSPYMQDNR